MPKHNLPKTQAIRVEVEGFRVSTPAVNSNMIMNT